MQKVFSTDDFPVHRRFQTWMDVWSDRFGPMNVRQNGDGSFHAHLAGVNVGLLKVSLSSYSGQHSEATPQAVRLYNKPHTLAFLMRLCGTAKNHQYDRTALQGPGDIIILDRSRPLASSTLGDTKTLVVELPRERLEDMLGPAALFAGVTVSAELPGASLVRTYFRELVQLGDQLSPEAAGRMAQIGVDLIVASVAERMAQDTPKPLQSTLTVQRAKAFIESNLGDPTLDPSQLALALGVSLRHLQQLFHERGHQVADWIWHRRLEVAARRLSDPAHAHLSIGALAYGCGFVSQAHFARRFKEQFSLSPRDYKREALLRLS